MPHVFPQILATGEFCRCWLSISSTRPLPVAGTSWERTVVLGAARSDCGVAGATMSQCIHSLRQRMKGLYCTCSTILVESRHPFERISNKRTCASQRATRADRVGERRRQVRVSSIATIGSYVCACQLGCSICQCCCASVKSDCPATWYASRALRRCALSNGCNVRAPHQLFSCQAQSTGRPKHARLCELARTEQLRVAHRSVQQLLAAVCGGIHVN